MTKGFSGIFLLVGILIVAALAGGAYYLVKQQAIKNINSFEECAKAGYPVMESYPEMCRTPDGRIFTKELSDEEKKKLQPTVDEMANWKTYSDEEFKYSIKYPAEDFGELYIVAESTESNFTYKHIAISTGRKGVWLAIESSIGGNTSQSIYCALEDEIEKTDVIIGGEKGCSSFVHVSRQGSDSNNLYYGFVRKGNLLITISMESQDQENLKSNKTLFNQILSTFKFLDSETSSE